MAPPVVCRLVRLLGVAVVPGRAVPRGFRSSLAGAHVARPLPPPCLGGGARPTPPRAPPELPQPTPLVGTFESGPTRTGRGGVGPEVTACLPLPCGPGPSPVSSPARLHRARRGSPGALREEGKSPLTLTGGGCSGSGPTAVDLVSLWGL